MNYLLVLTQELCKLKYFQTDTFMQPCCADSG